MNVEQTIAFCRLLPYRRIPAWQATKSGGLPHCQCPLSSPPNVHDQADNEQNDEQEEKDFRDSGKRHGHSTES